MLKSSKDFVRRELSHWGLDQSCDVIRNFAVAELPVRLQYQVAPFLGAQVEVDFTQTGQAQVGLQTLRLYY